MTLHRRPLRWMLGGTWLASIAAFVIGAYSTTWTHRGTWSHLGLGDTMSTHTLDFQLDGTLIITKLKGTGGSDGPRYHPTRTQRGVYHWEGENKLNVAIEGHQTIYIVPPST